MVVPDRKEAPIDDLRKQIVSLLPPHQITESEKERLMAAMAPFVATMGTYNFATHTSGPLVDVVLDGDGHDAVCFAADGTAWLWEIDTVNELRPFRYQGMPGSLAIAPGGDRIQTVVKTCRWRLGIWRPARESTRS